MISRPARGVIALISFLLLPNNAWAVSFDDITALVQAEAPQLALAMIDRHQPDAGHEPQAWVAWEKQRFTLYRQLEDYDRLNERISSLPAKLPADFYVWVIKEGINAFLIRGEPVKARRLIEKLSAEGYAEEVQTELRRMLVTSFLLEGKAQNAMHLVDMQTRHDTELDREWRVLIAKVLTANQRYEDAQVILVSITDDDVTPLKLFLDLKLKNLSIDTVIKQATKSKNALKDDKAAQIPYWAVIAEASRHKQDYKSQLWALEKVLSAGASDYLSGRLFAASADSLWEAYRQYGMKLADKEELDIDEDGFFDTAEELGKKDLFFSRSLYALAALAANSRDIRIEAHQAFIKTLYLNRYGHRVVNRLYLDSELFAQLSSVPDAVRHLMIGNALKHSDIQLASTLLEGMNKVPDDVDATDWRMRQARVHILAGKFQQGMQSLLELFKDVERLNNRQVDRLLQVLFDLQALGKHRTVYPLFETLMQRTTDDKRKREILYWMADSMKSLEEHEEAAHLYLKSAGLIDAGSMDLWAQSARYQAAESLARAGLVIDAKQVLSALLAVTKDPGRRALLSQQLERLKTSGRL